ncbi:MAG: nitroreductase family deazaflavin-dependent oxidoreductase [Acidimicrobiaceae bacterium]|nr:nitroreductase family deazaflavin-dependent oxidoreductase [Acidimicrobiaceae bacterium]
MLFGVLLFGIRTQNPTVLRGVRNVNKRFWNRQAIRTAGEPGAGVSKVVHRGRSSGTEYETPIDAIPTDDGFVVVLPYGTQADWVRNVLHHREATIVHDGERVDVHQPVLMHPRDVDQWFTPGARRVNRLFGVERTLVLRRR